MTEHSHTPGLPILFTLDGRPLTTRDKKLTAAAVLRLGGLDPAGYDLARIRLGHSNLERYTDDQQVEITPAALFVSIRQSAQVA